MRRRIVMATTMILVVQLLVTGSIGFLNLAANGTKPMGPHGVPMVMEHKITSTERHAAAHRAAEARRGAEIRDVVSLAQTAVAPDEAHAANGIDPKIPDYFGTSPNYANSPLPPNVVIAPATGDTTGTGAEAIATVQTVVGSGGVVTRGVVTAIKVTNPGSGYTKAPIITIDPTVSILGGGGDGSGATAMASIDSATGQVTQIAVTAGGSGYGGVRKFVDSLPGLTAAGANSFGQYIDLAVADTTSYPGSDYYEIGLVEYNQQFHSDLPASKLRGYVQLNNPATAYQVTRDTSGKITGWPQPHYLGATIVARRDVPVRIKFINLLPTGSGGDLFVPTDTTVMGAGLGPNGGTEFYTQNRATLHLHGGLTPWISDGTPHQWTTPAGETTAYPKGVSTQDVPDMPPSAPGEMTFFYSNQQSARLMFYHDHSYGITRLNVYAGEAAGYLLTDTFEQTLVAGGTIPGTSVNVPAETVPSTQIPLIIQDKTFVPGPKQLNVQDPTWNHIWRTGVTAPALGGLWMPHVYMPNQNPVDMNGTNAMGRWDYSQWFWPPTAPAHGTVPNPYAVAGTSEGPEIPGINNPSLTPEAFMDTPVVNGVAYPYLKLEQKVYRFRILNAANDRSLNLQLYYAKSNGDLWDAQGNLNDPNAGEVDMVPATGKPLPMGIVPPWPNDNRLGGVPNQKTVGPSWIQIGTEGGFLPAPVILNNRPVGYENNLRNIVVTNINTHTLMLAPAERADVIVDFSKVPAGSKLILYNDSPAPVPAFDPRYDYYTGDFDQSDSGGAPTTLAAYGPNTRTIMQFQVSGPDTAPTGLRYDQDSARMTTLKTALNTTFALSQDPIIVPEPDYNSTYGKTFPSVTSRIQNTSLTFTPNGGSAPITIGMKPKAIQELFELDYGRMNATMGVEIPNTTGVNQTTIPLGYIDPSTENIDDSITAAAPTGTLGDGTQIWKVTHNGVDTHAIHFHLFNVQIINRVGWDGQVRLPEANEIGWKDTVRMNPLEDAIVALRPIAARSPFGTYQSIRPLDVTMPLGSKMGFWPQDPLGNPVTTVNALFNFGDEYVWHCHLLGHEENDMMRPIVFNTKRTAPDAPTGVAVGNFDPASVPTTTAPYQAVLGNTVVLNWADTTPFVPTFGVAGNSWGIGKAEIGYRVLRAPITITTTTRGRNTTTTTSIGTYGQIATLAANATTFTDTPATAGSYSYQIVAYNDAGGTGVGSNVATAPSAAMNVTVPAPVVAPGAPTRLASSFQAAPLGVNLTWTASTGKVTGYTVQRSTDTGATWTNLGTPVTGTSFTDTAVVANTSYVYQVIAANAVGSTTSAQITVLTLPNAPTGLSSVPISSPPSVILRWIAPAGTITGYTVERSNNLISWQTIGTATATTYSDTTVAADLTYFYRVSASNATGASATTQPIIVTVKATLPAAPSNLNASLQPGQNQVSLTWLPGNTIAVDTYQVYRSPDINGPWSPMGAPTATTSFVDTTVAANTSYYYHIIATTARLGDSAPSGNLNVVTLPDAPTNLALVGTASAGAVTMNWSVPASGAASYQVQISTNNGTTWTNLGGEVIGTTSYTDKTAASGLTYLYRVLANNSTPAPGLPSNVLTVNVPLVLPNAVSSLTATADTTGVTLNWIAPTGVVSNYQVGRRTSVVGTVASSAWVTLTTTLPNTAISYVDSTAATNTSYDYQVVAVNSAGTGPASAPATALTLPSAPTGLTANAGGTGVTLAWTAPGGTGTIQNYIIEQSSTATGPWTVLTSVLGTITAYNDTVSVAGTYYHVIADNTLATTGGKGPASASATVLVGPTLTLGTVTATSVRLSWTKPTGTITGYTIDRQPSGGNWTAAAGMVSANINNANTTTYNATGIATGLTANTSYDYRVSARNGAVVVGTASNIVTPLTLPTVTIAVTAQAGPQVTISLNATGTGAITSFQIQRRVTGTAWPATWMTVSTTANSTTTIDTGVLAGTSYDYRATASNATGTGANSATVTVVIPLNAPTGLAATPANTSVALNWTSNSPTATGFYVERSTNGTTWTQIGTVARTTLTTYTYTNTGLTRRRTYQYRIRAYGASGGVTVYSPYSATVITTTL